MRLLLICFLLICSGFAVRAQQIQSGRITENKTQVVLINITVINLASQQQTVSNKQGLFRIAAKANDLLVFTGFGYRPDTVLVTDLKFKEVGLVPAGHLLNEVKINANTQVNKQATALPYDKDFHNQTMRYIPDEKYEGYYKGGVILRMWTNKSEEHHPAKLDNIARRDEVSKEIAKVFSNANIALYLPLKGRELDNFIIRYTPNIQTFKAAGFNLTDYLNASYLEFMKLPVAERQKTILFN